MLVSTVRFRPLAPSDRKAGALLNELVAPASFFLLGPGRAALCGACLSRPSWPVTFLPGAQGLAQAQQLNVRCLLTDPPKHGRQDEAAFSAGLPMLIVSPLLGLSCLLLTRLRERARVSPLAPIGEGAESPEQAAILLSRQMLAPQT